MNFAAATSGYEEASYVLYGVPLENSTSFRKGTGSAPDRVREMSHGLESYHPDADAEISEVGVHDYGDVDVWLDTEESLEYVEGVVRDGVDAGKTPVVVGGEHTVSLAPVGAVDADVAVVFDAHLDLKDEFQGSRYSHACVSRRMDESDVDVVVVGGRAGSRDEYSYLESSGVELIPPEDADVDELEDAIQGYRRPYVSVDVDVLEPGFASDVGTPEPYGLTPRKLRSLLKPVAGEAVGFDVVEARPSDAGSSTLYAASLVKEFVAWNAFDG